MKKRYKLIILFALVLCCIACDQSSKKIAKEKLENKSSIVFYKDLFRLQYAENNGAFLSLGSRLPDKLHFLMLRLIPLTAIIGMLIFMILKINTLPKLRFLSLALIFSGGLSNLFDRFFNNKLVIDFMNCGIGNIRTGIFNIADLYIVIGAVVLLSSYYSEEKEKGERTGLN